MSDSQTGTTFSLVIKSISYPCTFLISIRYTHALHTHMHALFFYYQQSPHLLVYQPFQCIYRENAVTSCRTCNGRKGSLPLSQLKSVGMRLAREPYVPTQYELHKTASRMLPRKVHSTWAPFLAMNNPSQENTVEGATQEECEAYLEGEL